MSITIVPGIPVYIWEQMLYGDSSRVTRRTHLPIEPLLTTTSHFPHIVVGPPGIETLEKFTVKRHNFTTSDNKAHLLRKKRIPPPLVIVGGNKVIDATEYAAKQVDVGWVAILSRLGYEGISWILSGFSFAITKPVLLNLLKEGTKLK